LDETGKVIGVVVSGIAGTGINHAIPVNLLHEFLLGPELVFTPPELTSANLDAPVEFTKRAR
jgi:S1-C subfamily serine protease